MNTAKSALVLGASGGIGGELGRRLLARGWSVRALHRDAATAAVRFAGNASEWVQGDAMNQADVIRAASGVSLIVHAVNPPGYRNWAGLVLPMIDASIAAARASGARILLPGTVYNYGPDALPEPDETSPQHPLTRKGAIRAELEQRLRLASHTGVRTLIVRAGDFFGQHAANSWFFGGMLKPGQPLRRIVYPGQQGIGHQWAYLPDVAETMIRLVEREALLARFDTIHMNGHWDEDGTQLIAAIRRAADNSALPVNRFPWWIVPLAAPVVPLLRELREMRYLWQTPVRLRNRRLLSLLGEEPHTPLDQAIHATLAAMGCLPTSQAV